MMEFIERNMSDSNQNQGLINLTLQVKFAFVFVVTMNLFCALTMSEIIFLKSLFTLESCC